MVCTMITVGWPKRDYPIPLPRDRREFSARTTPEREFSAAWLRAAARQRRNRPQPGIAFLTTRLAAVAVVRLADELPQIAGQALPHCPLGSNQGVKDLPVPGPGQSLDSGPGPWYIAPNSIGYRPERVA